jgi:hypothetical protein
MRTTGTSDTYLPSPRTANQKPSEQYRRNGYGGCRADGATSPARLAAPTKTLIRYGWRNEKRGAGPAANRDIMSVMGRKRTSYGAPSFQFDGPGVSNGPARGCGSETVRWRCREPFASLRITARLGRQRSLRFGIRSVGRRGSVGRGESPSRSSACSRRTGLSELLKIRVSMVRFRPWPPFPAP